MNTISPPRLNISSACRWSVGVAVNLSAITMLVLAIIGWAVPSTGMAGNGILLGVGVFALVFGLVWMGSTSKKKPVAAPRRPPWAPKKTREHPPSLQELTFKSIFLHPPKTPHHFPREVSNRAIQYAIRNGFPLKKEALVCFKNATFLDLSVPHPQYREESVRDLYEICGKITISFYPKAPDPQPTACRSYAELPHELLLHIFRNLSFKEVCLASRTCRTWRGVLQDETIVARHATQRKEVKQGRIRQETERALMGDAKAHIALSEFGLSTLELAHHVARVDNSMSERAAIGKAYIARNQLEQASSIFEEMVNKAAKDLVFKDILGESLVKWYAQHNDFPRALAILKKMDLDNKVETRGAFCVFMWHAGRGGAIDEAIEALTDKDVIYVYSMREASIKDLVLYLSNKGCLEQANRIQALSPEACAAPPDMADVEYYARAGQKERAEEIAHSYDEHMSGMALNWIRKEWLSRD